eukprot:7168769-Alexandrium_andersonii.AAC.1
MGCVSRYLGDCTCMCAERTAIQGPCTDFKHCHGHAEQHAARTPRALNRTVVQEVVGITPT